MTALLRLYPRAWRDRYGAELEGVLEDRPPGVLDRLDLIGGALDAHLHPELAAQSQEASMDRTSAIVADALIPAHDDRIARRLGVAALVGIVAWLVAWYLAATGPIVSDGGAAYRDGAAAFPFIILAMALLAAGLIGQLIVLPRSARVARAGALIAIPSVVLWSLGPWVQMTAVASLIGLAVLAVGVILARAWPLVAAVGLLAALIGAPVILLSVPQSSVITTVEPALVAFVMCLLVPPLAIGATLLRPRSTNTSAAA